MMHRYNAPRTEKEKREPHFLPNYAVGNFYYIAIMPTRTIIPAVRILKSDSRDAASRLPAALWVCTVMGAVMVAFALMVVLVPMVVFIMVMPGERLVVAFAARAANWTTVALVGLKEFVSGKG